MTCPQCGADCPFDDRVGWHCPECPWTDPRVPPAGESDGGLGEGYDRAILRDLGPVHATVRRFVADLSAAATAGRFGEVHSLAARFHADVVAAQAAVQHTRDTTASATELLAFADHAHAAAHDILLGEAAFQARRLMWKADATASHPTRDGVAVLVQDGGDLDYVLHARIFTRVLAYKDGQVEQALARLFPFVEDAREHEEGAAPRRARRVRRGWWVHWSRWWRRWSRWWRR